MNKFIQSNITVRQFMKLPVFILKEEYSQLSITAKMLYAVLLDRTMLSVENDWRDEEGNIYIRFSQEGAAQILSCGLTSIKKAFRELAEKDLVVTTRDGPGLSNRIYVKVPEKEIAETQTVGFRPSRQPYSDRLDSRNPTMNHTKKNQTNNNQNTGCYNYEFNEGDSL